MAKELQIARVAKVIDEYHLVITQGSDGGVELGDKYLIYGVGEEITDPISGNSLGILEIVRGRAKVIHLQPTLATLESIETYTTAGKKRVIKRDGISAAIMGYGAEEITEGSETHMAQLEGAQRGDIARPV